MLNWTSCTLLMTSFEVKNWSNLLTRVDWYEGGRGYVWRSNEETCL